MHRSHDYLYLVERWKALAKSLGLSMKAFAKAGEWPLYQVTSRAAVRFRSRPAIYLSAGVHGDEPAPNWGLLEWAEAHAGLFETMPFIIYPCLNPHGLLHNLRADERGVDINRSFHKIDDPLVAAWHRSLLNRKLAVAVHLHEDYDALGIYLYELNAGESIGRRLLAEASEIIPLDGRVTIEGRKARHGLIVRRNAPTDLPGLPEALATYNLGAPVALTFESPSEFSLIDRIAVHKRFIESVLNHVGGL